MKRLLTFILFPLLAWAQSSITVTRIGPPTVTPPATFTISGTISGPSNSGLTVNCATCPTASTTSDGSGNFTFTGVANGSYTITPVAASGYTITPPSEVVTISGGNNTATFTSAATTYSISGTIVNQGGGNTGIQVSATGRPNVTTDASGNFTFSGLSPASYTITPAATSNVSILPPNRVVPITNSSVTTGVVFSSMSGYVISGQINGPIPTAGASIILTAKGIATATGDWASSGGGANVAGGYSLNAGLPDGHYIIIPTRSGGGYSFTPTFVEVTVSGGNVTAPPIDSQTDSTVHWAIYTRSTGNCPAAIRMNAERTDIPGFTTSWYSTGGAYDNGMAIFPANGVYQVTPVPTPGHTYNPATLSVSVANANTSYQAFSCL